MGFVPKTTDMVSKLMGYDYEITYKKGKDNILEDALSHTFDNHVSLSVVSMPILNWLQSVHKGYVNDSSLFEIIQYLSSNPSAIMNYPWDGSSLRYKGFPVLP